MQTDAPSKQTLRSKRWPLRWLSLLAVVVAFAVLGKTFFSPLPKGAYSVLSTTHWAGRSPDVGIPPYVWLPNGDVAYTEQNAQGLLQVCYQKVDISGTVGGGRRGPTLPPTPALPPSVHSGRFLPSPDERWVAYVQTVGKNRSGTLLISADGKTTRSVSPIGVVIMEWRPDSRSFLGVSLIPPLSMKVYHLDSTQTETIPSGAWETPDPMIARPNSPNFLIDGHFSQTTSNGKPHNYPIMTLHSFDLSHPNGVLQMWQAPVPLEMEFGSVLASPDNTHLLWVTGSWKPPLWSQWIHRIIPMHQVSPFPRISYFLSDLHGGNRRPLLEYSLGRSRNMALTWTPDSKHLSFIYKDQLYLVPIN